MKPFVAIDGVLDYLFAKYFGSVSVDDCAQTEIACSAYMYGPVRGPGATFQPRTGPYAEHAISDLSQSAFKMHTQVLERSRTALWRLIDATAKSSSSLNTYPIPDFFGPAAMQRDTFSRARKILGIRILPRAPTLQTYLFWPIGVNHATAKPSSSLNTYPIPDFF